MTTGKFPHKAQLETVARWAWADLRRDTVISTMSILLLLLLIGPPLFLAVIRASVVESWATALQADARNREVIIIGETPLTDARLAELAELPHTGFIVPEPSTFISTVRLQGEGRPAALDMRTSAAGDPMLGSTPEPHSPDHVTLTSAAAERLAVGPGDKVAMTLRRLLRDGSQENLTIPLQVSGIVPAETWTGEIAFLHPARAAGATLWLQPGSGNTDAIAAPGADVWRSLRIYAVEVRQAPALAAELTRLGFDTRIASEQVSLLVTLSDGLRRLMSVTVLGGLAGLTVAVWLLQVLSVSRRQREIALMETIGLDRAGIIIFFVLQALILSIAALLLAALLLLPMHRFAITFAQSFLQRSEDGSGLDITTLATAAGAVLCLALAAGAVAAWRIHRLDLSTDLRAD